MTATYFEILELIQFLDNRRTLSLSQIYKTKGCRKKCIITSSYMYEFINFDYLSSFENWLENGMFFIMILYFGVRHENSKNFLPNMSHLEYPRNDSEGEDKKDSKIAVTLNTFMIIFIFFKINTWARLDEQFSSLYTLVIECIKDISLFMFFFLYWIFFFGVLFMIVGGEFQEK